jgi:hypothetical protein
MVTVAGCFPGSGKSIGAEPAGFFTGIWHGWIAPLSLVVGIFDKGVRIYETNNVGWWYDFAYYIAIIAGFGGISVSRRRRKKEAGPR